MLAWIHDGYPGGSRQEFTNPQNLAWKQKPSKLVLHTVEGGGYPSAATYDDGRRAPHVTADPWHQTWRQHYPLTEASWALKVGTVSTNTLGAVQVEIIGTCDPGNKALAAKFVPGMTGEPLRWLVGLLRHIADSAGIPWQASVTWVAYPGSYGPGPQRLTAAAWTAYRGLIGHQHVPGNSHGDPGAIPITTWLAAGAGTATPEEGEDMALTPEQDRKINAIFDAIFNGGTSMPEGKPLKDLIADGGTATRADLARIEAKVDAIGAAAGVNVDALAAEVASRLTITPREA